jgi:hypothetical protein
MSAFIHIVTLIAGLTAPANVSLSGEFPARAPELEAVAARLGQSGCPVGDHTRVTPCDSLVTAPRNATNRTVTFRVANLSITEDESYDLKCTFTAPVTACSAPSFRDVWKNSSVNVNVTYSTGSDGGSGNITLIATSAFNADQGTGRVTVSVTQSPPTLEVMVTPDNQTGGAVAGVANTHYFTIKNTGNTSATFALQKSCSGAVPGTCLLSKTSVLLAPGVSTTASISYTAGAAGGTGVAKLIASYSTARDSGWLNV